MYTIDDLNLRLLSELKEIAEGMGVKNAKKLAKQDLVYKILDQQAISGEPEPATPVVSKKQVPAANEPERKMRPRRRENVAPEVVAPPREEEKEISNISNEEAPQNFNNNEETKEISKLDEVQEIIAPIVEIVRKEVREERPYQNPNQNQNPNQHSNPERKI
jgi:transcription termination factor Rho